MNFEYESLALIYFINRLAIIAGICWRICASSTIHFLGSIKNTSYQLLILILHLKFGSDAIPCVKESSPLALLRQVVDEDADQVDGDQDDDVGDDGLPLGDQVKLRVQHDHADDGVGAGQQQPVGHRDPGSEMKWNC